MKVERKKCLQFALGCRGKVFQTNSMVQIAHKQSRWKGRFQCFCSWQLQSNNPALSPVLEPKHVTEKPQIHWPATCFLSGLQKDLNITLQKILRACPSTPCFMENLSPRLPTLCHRQSQTEVKCFVNGVKTPEADSGSHFGAHAVLHLTHWHFLPQDSLPCPSSLNMKIHKVWRHLMKANFQIWRDEDTQL